MSRRHLYLSYRETLIPIATWERDARRRLYPEMVAKGEIEHGDALADLTAWEAIALWCEGRTIPFDFTYEQMAVAAGRALIKREEKAAASPADAGRASQRDAVAELYEALSEHRDWMAAMNATLRRDAEARKAAAT